MLYCIPPDKHNLKDLKAIFEEHPEVKFVSFVGIDIMGNDTDEKIPVSVFLKDYDDLICKGFLAIRMTRSMVSRNRSRIWSGFRVPHPIYSCCIS